MLNYKIEIADYVIFLIALSKIKTFAATMFIKIWAMYTRCVVICLIIVTSYVCSLNLVVNGNDSLVQGFIHDVGNGINVRIFLGIPFAKPPVDNLRFEVRCTDRLQFCKKKPVEPDKWIAPVGATKYRSACYPHDRLKIHTNPALFSEDCLHLKFITSAHKGCGNIWSANTDN
ncbi:unnamed protein product [Enterobius vermicularis]|uniref:COesterase domain-containing protein n=1 Tax=Enterobius vermicularis TaxID=51028 RepID=A0A0N4VIU5_ENTVE|nr:unnamed protein product [Enterobius vermicularis]